jgi:hypothetical protein
MDTLLKSRDQIKPPYLILHKQSRILSMSNSIACAFDNIGPKCKMMYRFKISACAGMTNPLNALFAVVFQKAKLILEKI